MSSKNRNRIKHRFVYFRTHSERSKGPLVLRLYYVTENFILLIIYDRFIDHIKLLNNLKRDFFLFVCFVLFSFGQG